VLGSYSFSGGASEQKYAHFGDAISRGHPGQPAELASIYVTVSATSAGIGHGSEFTVRLKIAP
jgi:hypothetical protein